MPGWTKASVVSFTLIGILAIVVASMWLKLNHESQSRCDSINVVSHLFRDVGRQQTRPDKELFDAYVQLKAYSSNHPDRLGAAFLVNLLENSFTGNGAATPTTILLQKAGEELERACAR
jgi:hypothetical protein